MTWPLDADGDVFRRLEVSGFNFKVPHTIDFNVDFDSWPPPEEDLKKLHAVYKIVRIYEPEDDFNGYVQISIIETLTYDLVIKTQNTLSDMMEKYGGFCASWGIIQEPNKT